MDQFRLDAQNATKKIILYLSSILDNKNFITK
jgi:hypothetical protein